MIETNTKLSQSITPLPSKAFQIKHFNSVLTKPNLKPETFVRSFNSTIKTEFFKKGQYKNGFRPGDPSKNLQEFPKSSLLNDYYKHKQESPKDRLDLLASKKERYHLNSNISSEKIKMSYRSKPSILPNSKHAKMMTKRSFSVSLAASSRSKFALDSQSSRKIFESTSNVQSSKWINGSRNVDLLKSKLNRNLNNLEANLKENNSEDLNKISQISVGLKEVLRQAKLRNDQF
jgi:hypothetical protein